MRPGRFVLLIVALQSVALASCDGDEAVESEQAVATQEQEQARAPATFAGRDRMTQRAAPGCPMMVEGTDVEVSDIDGGVALTFTTENEQSVGDLRSRVEHMASMYEMHRGRGSMMWQHMRGGRMGRRGPGMGAGHMGPGGPMPGANATVTELDDGARLELRPTDPSQLEDLREHARAHQQRMQSGECWMMHDQAEPTNRR